MDGMRDGARMTACERATATRDGHMVTVRAPWVNYGGGAVTITDAQALAMAREVMPTARPWTDHDAGAVHVWRYVDRDDVETWADGYGRWHASVPLTAYPRTDAAIARRAIRRELEARDRGAWRFSLERELVTLTGRAIYGER